MVADRERDVTLKGLIERRQLQALVEKYSRPAARPADDDEEEPLPFAEALASEMQVAGPGRGYGRKDREDRKSGVLPCRSSLTSRPLSGKSCHASEIHRA